MDIHKSITWERIETAVKESLYGMGHPGFCLACGEDSGSVEPDAQGYTCDCCGEPQVCGAETVLACHF